MTYTAKDLTLCRSNTGDGGWSLHLGDDFYPLVSGPAEWIPETEEKYGSWNRPDQDDYEEALRIANREELPGCVWKNAETPFCDSY